MANPSTPRCAWLSGLALLIGALVVAPLTPAPKAQGSGVRVERVLAPRASEVGVGDRRITIARFDPARFELRFLTSMRHGAPRPMPEWVRDFDLVAGTNAGMFLPNRRPLGWMQYRGDVWSSRRAGNHHAVIAFDPLAPGGPAVAMGGRGCGRGLDEMRGAFGSLLQTRRLLVDCRGRPTRWRTNRYSAAAIGVDRDGWIVMVHSRTPYRMHVLGRMLADDALGIRGLTFVEGGPEASLVVNAGGRRVREMGSWEDGFNPNDDNHAFWELPNVIGVARR